LIRSCRRKPKPYSVTTMKHTDFVDVKLLARQILRNTTKTTSGETVQWMHIKWLRFEKDEPNIVKFGYSVNADEFCIIGDSLAICLSGSCIGYTSRQQISLAKKERSLESTVSKNNPSRLRVILCQPAICCSSYRSPS